MTIDLYAHPFSSYCQKVLMALYENDTPFNYRLLDGQDAATGAQFAERWPIRHMPLLVDGDEQVAESSVIIEYLQLRHPGAQRFIPADPAAALEVRFLDRFFDNYVMTPMQRIVFMHMRPEEQRDQPTLDQSHAMLDTAYRWLDARLGANEWASAHGFSLADCAAAPSLFYADWIRPIPAELPRLRAYRNRLLAHPSFARAVDEARPFRHFFPPGAPDRD
ncbi:MAG: glutathione S-transferase family protein [Telluria sp.]